jgi:hypothetical protein
MEKITFLMKQFGQNLRFLISDKTPTRQVTLFGMHQKHD